MKAIRYYGPKDLRLEDIPEPVVGPGQVKVKIAWCGICGTDLHMYQHSISDGPPTATEPHPTSGETLPVGVGHEFSGTIVESGPDVDTSKHAVGQNVAVEPIIGCNKPGCACAESHTRNLCSQFAAIGIHGGGGGLSEYVVVPQELAHILPANVSLEIGALVEPLAVAWRAIKLSHVKAGDKVLILGAGPIGIFVLKVAQIFGATWVGISGRGSKRCALAHKYGASAVYDASTGIDVVAETLKATNGRGADVVVDCAGSQSTLDTALKATRPGGTVMNVAGWTARPTIDMNLMLMKELVLANSIGYAGDHPELIQALADGKFDLDDLEALITRRVGLEEYLEKGLGALLHEKDQHDWAAGGNLKGYKYRPSLRSGHVSEEDL
ncbi:(R,R)-butanediol dehydrogenase [Trametes pubescens]|uniref:(R,R)-butanediol dehydrogenase n=1 Tax=Trametes pubescens TaxID=154538 RepID=A0A1M2V806_TRAPU|nr:(R,R)-butanediol dehydrogenase [Trametes pubescens]